MTTTSVDGTVLRLRVATPDDVGELLAGFEEFGDESRYRRFFTAKPHLSEPVLDHLSSVDREVHVAIAAFDPARPSSVGGEDGAGVGVVRIIRPGPDDEEAEFSIAVIDAYQHRGVGHLLMDAAAVVARELGIRRMLGSVLAENLTMRNLAMSLGATRLESEDPAILVYLLDVDAAIASVDDRRHEELAGLW